MSLLPCHTDLVTEPAAGFCHASLYAAGQPMRTAVLGVFALILVCVMLAEGIAAEQGVLAVVAGFYENRAFYIVASVADLTADPEGVAVRLDIDRCWRDVSAR